MVRVFRSLLWLMASMLPCACAAQAPPEGDPTLHVFVNRVQIPVLVLSPYGRPMRPLPERDFRITLDGVGSFTPTHVRLEGDDPLAVAVIVDASDPYERMWQDLPKAVDKLLPTLHAQDKLMLYGLDGCKALRFLPEDAWLNVSVVHAGVDRALAMKAPVRDKTQTALCPRGLTMADMVAYVTTKLSTFPGRRMIVTVGAGTGSGYASRMDELKAMLNARSIMLVPMVHDAAFAAMPMPYLPHRSGSAGVVNGADGPFGTLVELSEFSGGRVQYVSTHEFPGALADAVALARGRYILEFPRPEKLAAGHYRISVTDGHPRDFIRASGISVPVANAEEIAAAKATAASAIPASGTPDHLVIQQPPQSSQVLAVQPPADSPKPVAKPAEAPALAPAAQSVKSPTLPDLTDITDDLRPTR